MDTIEKEGMAARLLEGLCRLFATIGTLVMLTLAVTTVVSVLGRYFFNSPISGDVELVELGCAVAVTMFLPYCQLRQGNVIVDFFTLKAPPRFKNVLDAIGCLLLTGVGFMLAWRMGLGGHDLYRYNDQTMILRFPTWVTYIFIIPSLVLFTLAGLLTAWRSLKGTHGKDLAEQAVEELVDET